MIDEKLNKAILELASRVGLRINSIVLFGSHARSEDLQWSDIDLLIISENFSGMRSDDRVRMVLDKWDYEKPLEPVCSAPSEASELSPLIWEICKDGIIIIDDGTFNKLRIKCLKYLNDNGVQRFKYGYMIQG
jgi:predicted nucleotidyltransferase